MPSTFHPGWKCRYGVLPLFSFFPFPSVLESPSQIQLGLGSSVSFPRGSRWSPANKWFLVYFELKIMLPVIMLLQTFSDNQVYIELMCELHWLPIRSRIVFKLSRHHIQITYHWSAKLLTIFHNYGLVIHDKATASKVKAGYPRPKPTKVHTNIIKYYTPHAPYGQLTSIFLSNRSFALNSATGLLALYEVLSQSFGCNISIKICLFV